MEITEVTVQLVPQGPVLAYCRAVLGGCFRVCELKLVDRGPARPLLAMPSRKRTLRCWRCAAKHPARDRFCGACGAANPRAEEASDQDDHHDLCYPITAAAREDLHAAVERAYAVARGWADDGKPPEPAGYYRIQFDHDIKAA